MNYKSQAQKLSINSEVMNTSMPTTIKPEVAGKRMKLLIYGESGIGKTTFCINFPYAVYIDTERGAQFKPYTDKLAENKSLVVNATDIREVIKYIRHLKTTKHDRQSIIIDNLTDVYNKLNNECIEKYGIEYGRSTMVANKFMDALFYEMTDLDMNVVFVCGSKTKWKTDSEPEQEIYDCYKRTGNKLDIILEMYKEGGAKTPKRIFYVHKSRMGTDLQTDSIIETTFESFINRFKNTIVFTKEAIATTEKITEEQMNIVEMLTNNYSSLDLDSFIKSYQDSVKLKNENPNINEFGMKRANHFILSLISKLKISSLEFYNLYKWVRDGTIENKTKLGIDTSDSTLYPKEIKDMIIEGKKLRAAEDEKA